MSLQKSLSNFLTRDPLIPALVAGGTLFLSSIAINFVLFRLGLPAAATLVDDLAVGFLAGLLCFYLFTAISVNQEYKRAKERMILVAELNHHIRNALTIIECADSILDKEARIQRVEEALDRIDWVLTDLLPTVGSAKNPRFSSPGPN